VLLLLSGGGDEEESTAEDDKDQTISSSSSESESLAHLVLGEAPGEGESMSSDDEDDKEADMMDRKTGGGGIRDGRLELLLLLWRGQGVAVHNIG